jgi:hypothetical protein
MEQSLQNAGDSSTSLHITNIFSDENKIIIGLMLFGLLCRLYNLTAPLLDYHSWRQTDTAAIARNFYYNGFNILYPQIDWGGAGPGYVESEFQLVPFIIAIFYKIFGVHEYVARLVIIAFSIGSIYFLYKLIRIYYSRRVAIFSAIFFIISPMELYFGRTVMPDSAMIFFSIGSLYFFNKWTNDEKNSSLILSIICTTLAFLVKISTLYLGLPLLWLAYAKYGKRLLFEPKLYLFAILALIPPAMWYYFAHSVLSQYNTFDFWNLGSGTKFASLETLIDPWIYITLFKNLAIYVFTPIGLLLFVYALSLKSEAKDYLFHFWFLAVIIFFVLIPLGTIGNDYYQRALIPPVAVFVGRALSGLYERKKVLSYILIVLIFVSSIYYMANAYNQMYPVLDAGKTVDKIIDENDLIITTSWIGSSPNILYYSNRNGWVVPSETWSEQTIEHIKGLGAKLLVITPQTLLSDNPTFARQMFGKYRSIIGSNFVMFDLYRTSDMNLPPDQDDLSFRGSGALIGGNIEESPLGLINITCFYNRSSTDSITGKLGKRDYGLAVSFIDEMGQTISEKRFLASELSASGITRNNYVTSLSFDEKAKIYDVQVRLDEVNSASINTY